MAISEIRDKQKHSRLLTLLRLMEGEQRGKAAERGHGRAVFRFDEGGGFLNSILNKAVKKGGELKRADFRETIS